VCSFFHDKVLKPGSLFRCGNNAIIYQTEIPILAPGALAVTLGRGYLADGSVEGIRSRVPSDASRAPSIAPSQGCFVQF
jgi:hypothetical protein